MALVEREKPGAGAEQRRSRRPRLDIAYGRLANAGAACVALFSALSVGPPAILRQGAKTLARRQGDASFIAVSPSR